MKWKTRYNTRPDGKPRVYLTGHPDDCAKYRDRHIDELRELFDCAVYFDPDPEHPEDMENFYGDIDRMNLIVLLISGKFITEETLANRVFRYAVSGERTVRVLPLLVEPGIEQAVNEVYGNLQLLNPYSTDPTEIPYREKLKAYLDAALFGANLAAEVRKEFACYLFLSYRKRDRRYANELMRRIHANDFCRDVAIWYDELLTAGRNFEEGIFDALDKSALAVMAITPNMLEPENYVIETEYREILHRGKPVLPVELVPTDREALRGAFAGIPPCTDAYDPYALASALENHLSGLEKAKPGGARHAYLIGLAYLYGIDVEVDRERATALIAGAAAEDLPEAVEKLVNMYETGDGVQRDLSRALYWQRQAVRILRKAYAERADRETGMRLIAALTAFGDLCLDMADADQAKKAYDEASALSDGYGIPFLHYVTSVKLGDAYRAKGELCAAKQAYEAGLAASRQMNTDFEQGVCLVRLGDLRRNNEQPADALRDYADAFPLLSAAYEKKEGTAVQHALLALHVNRGVAYEALHRYDLAADCYGEALRLCNRVDAACKTLADWQVLAECFQNLGEVYAVEQKYDAAEKCYLRCREIREELVRRLGTSQAKRELALCYDCIGHMLYQRGQVSAAKQAYIAAYDLRKPLSEAGLYDCLRDLSVSHSCLGKVAYGAGDFSAAQDHYRKALRIKQELRRRSDSEQLRTDIAQCCNNLGVALKNGGDLSGAEHCYASAVELLRPLAAQPSAVHACELLANVQLNLGNLRLEQGEPVHARPHFRESLALRRWLTAQAKTPALFEDLLTVLKQLARSAHLAGTLPEDTPLLLDAITVLEETAAQWQGVEANRRTFFSICCDLAEHCAAADAYGEAIRFLTRASELLSRVSPTKKDLCDAAKIDLNLGHLYRAQGDLSAAKAHFRASLDRWERLAASSAEDAVLFGIVECSRGLSAFCSLPQEAGAILGYLQKAMQAQEILMDRQPEDLERMRTFADLCEEMGLLFFNQRLPENARRCFEQSVLLNRRRWEREPTEESAYRLALSCAQYAVAAPREDAGKRECAETAAHLLLQLLSAHPGHPAYTDLLRQVREIYG